MLTLQTRPSVGQVETSVSLGYFSTSFFLVFNNTCLQSSVCSVRVWHGTCCLKSCQRFVKCYHVWNRCKRNLSFKLKQRHFFLGWVFSICVAQKHIMFQWYSHCDWKLSDEEYREQQHTCKSAGAFNWLSQQSRCDEIADRKWLMIWAR